MALVDESVGRVCRLTGPRQRRSGLVVDAQALLCLAHRSAKRDPGEQRLQGVARVLYDAREVSTDRGRCAARQEGEQEIGLEDEMAHADPGRHQSEHAIGTLAYEVSLYALMASPGEPALVSLKRAGEREQ